MSNCITPEQGRELLQPTAQAVLDYADECAQLKRDFERVQHVGLSKYGEWVSKDAIGERINEIEREYELEVEKV